MGMLSDIYLPHIFHPFLRHIFPTQTPVFLFLHLACPTLTQTQLGGTEIVTVCNAVSGAIRGCKVAASITLPLCVHSRGEALQLPYIHARHTAVTGRPDWQWHDHVAKGWCRGREGGTQVVSEQLHRVLFYPAGPGELMGGSAWACMCACVCVPGVSRARSPGAMLGHIT